MKCWKDEEDVYFPVSYLKKRFDMTGKLGKDGSTFELYTSYAKMRSPDSTYDPLGPFGHFSTYSVETRDRVRCVSAKTGEILQIYIFFVLLNLKISKLFIFTYYAEKFALPKFENWRI